MSVSMPLEAHHPNPRGVGMVEVVHVPAREGAHNNLHTCRVFIPLCPPALKGVNFSAPRQDASIFAGASGALPRGGPW